MPIDPKLITGVVVHEGDARNLPLPDECVTCIFADPPYNLGVDYGCGPTMDKLPTYEYLGWTTEWVEECSRVLKPDGTLWVLMREQFADEVGRILSGWIPRRNRIIWRERFAQYCESKFSGGHRHLFMHVKSFHNHKWRPGSVREMSVRMKMKDKRAAGPRVPDDVWDVSRLQGNDRERVGWHPCQLRQWPIARAILCCTDPGDLVLDPFCGSGSTLMAAAITERRAVGFDLNPEYVKLCRERIR